MPEHLAWPIRLAGDRLAVVEQDSDDDITQCVNVLLATRRGERVELPGFGITDPTFTTSIDVGEIVLAIDQWEPRAGHVQVATSLDAVDPAVRDVVVARLSA